MLYALCPMLYALGLYRPAGEWSTGTLAAGAGTTALEQAAAARAAAARAAAARAAAARAAAARAAAARATAARAATARTAKAATARAVTGELAAGARTTAGGHAARKKEKAHVGEGPQASRQPTKQKKNTHCIAVLVGVVGV
jgi:hypothetical protein